MNTSKVAGTDDESLNSVLSLKFLTHEHLMDCYPINYYTLKKEFS